MKKYFLTIVLLSFAGLIWSQSPNYHLFVKDHLNLTLTNTWSKSRETPTFGSGASLGLRPDVGGRLGLIYTINLGQRIGIETGTYLGVQSIGYRVKVENDRNYPLNNFRFRDAMAYVEIPIRVFGRFRITDKLYSFSYLGAHVTRFRDYAGGFTINDTLNRQAARFNYSTNTFYGMYLFWDLGSGFLIRNSSGDMFRINLVWHPVADRSWLMEGNYRYLNPESGEIIETGNWNWGGGYVGIEVGYVFTRARELKRDLEKLK
jgi:hypothetical protein